MAPRFANRADAGRRLAARLTEVLGRSDTGEVLVLGLAPGGVTVAVEVARALSASLDVLVVRGLTAPGSETVVGALAGEEPSLRDEKLMGSLGVRGKDLATEIRRQRAELHRRERLYRHGRPALPVEGRTVVVVSDGLTARLTAKAAVRALRARRPARLLVAAPVCDTRLAAELRPGVDGLVCLYRTRYVHAAGPWYEDFHEVTDREIVDLLEDRAAFR